MHTENEDKIGSGGEDSYQQTARVLHSPGRCRFLLLGFGVTDWISQKNMSDATKNKKLKAKLDLMRRELIMNERRIKEFNKLYNKNPRSVAVAAFGIQERLGITPTIPDVGVLPEPALRSPTSPGRESVVAGYIEVNNSMSTSMLEPLRDRDGGDEPDEMEIVDTKQEQIIEEEDEEEVIGFDGMMSSPEFGGFGSAEPSPTKPINIKQAYSNMYEYFADDGGLTPGGLAIADCKAIIISLSQVLHANAEESLDSLQSLIVAQQDAKNESELILERVNQEQFVAFGPHIPVLKQAIESDIDVKKVDRSSIGRTSSTPQRRLSRRISEPKVAFQEPEKPQKKGPVKKAPVSSRFALKRALRPTTVKGEIPKPSLPVLNQDTSPEKTGPKRMTRHHISFAFKKAGKDESTLPRPPRAKRFELHNTPVGANPPVSGTLTRNASVRSGTSSASDDDKFGFDDADTDYSDDGPTDAITQAKSGERYMSEAERRADRKSVV